jgi:3-phenylpropionate/trans-cinnamate dioxygenase ferredoxin reductase subunit
MLRRVVIVGAGQAGVQAALSLRDGGFDGEVILLGEEPGWPYQKPPLSKAYLLGQLDETGILLKSPKVYSDYRIDLRDGVQVAALDRAERCVRLAAGAPVAFDHLILATGARQRPLTAPGAGLNGVYPLRSLAHAETLAAAMAGASRAVVVGGGFIGLEFAAVARAKGLDVTVVEIGPRTMARALSGPMSEYLEARHRDWGVSFRLGVGVEAIDGADQVASVQLTDGTRLAADLVLVGTGVEPNAELAAAAGLEVADGIVVDAALSTSDAAISAIGDCARHPSRFHAAGVARIESVQNATDQGRFVAARLLGQTTPYEAVPWFWSDQGDVKLQIAGLGAGHDACVVRGDPASGAFSVFCFREDRLMAVESVNRGADHVLARRLIGTRAAVTPGAVQDPDTPLKSLLS